MILSCASAFVRHFVYFLSHAQIFKLAKHSVFPEFHSGLIWIQTVFANVERERERERETGAYTSFRENQSASADRQVEREREREREREKEKERERDVCVCSF